MVLVAKTIIRRVAEDMYICPRHHLCNVRIILVLNEATLRFIICPILITRAATTVVIAEDSTAGTWTGLVAYPIHGIQTLIRKQVANHLSLLEKVYPTIIVER